MLSQVTEKNLDSADENAEHEPVDHRTIVGQRRRAITETKIIHAAVHVFAEQGLEAPVIDDFIRAAGIARGTFYNYFKSTDELLRATSHLLTEEMILAIDNEIRSLKDPAIRYGVGTRLWMRWAEGNPLWCRFITRVWNSVKYEMPFQDIREGIRKKVFVAPDAHVAWDVISGAIRQAMFRIGEGSVRRNYGDAVVQMCLQALGVSAKTTLEIMTFELPEVPARVPGSWVLR
jgi:AcrR family transcriptional regulator